jgi:hypothetical protein
MPWVLSQVKRKWRSLWGVFRETLAHVKDNWDGPARALIGNWLRSVQQLSASRSYTNTSA